MLPALTTLGAQDETTGPQSFTVWRKDGKQTWMIQYTHSVALESNLS